ncbi:MAG: MBL fold metallo-hydrolase [Actinobacteria bacterium]|nr:MBL fold metallo-hydrolase [Actinomycetota bacterium]
MIDLARTIRGTKVPQGSLALFWAGQAGFAFKTGRGMIVYVDPYLSDAAERLHGFKRIMPTLIAPEDLEADLVVCTHEHVDHLDIDAIPLMARNPRIRFAGPAECVRLYRNLGISEDRYYRLDEGAELAFDGFSVRGVYADHGELAPGAVGVLLDFDGIRVYHTGDTAYRPERMRWAVEARVDILLPCINGAFGNLNAREAAHLVRDIQPRVAIPNHYWMFAEQNGDPGAFLEACRELAPDARPVLLTLGECFLYTLPS